jgi:hypothetical protein
MYFFTTIEFYVIAIAIALVLIAFFLKSRNEASKYSYIYQGEISYEDDHLPRDDEYVVISSLDNGKVEIIHHNVVLPLEATVNIKIDVCGDKAVCVEKMVDALPDKSVFLGRIKYTVPCFKHIAYAVEYECVYNGKWCTFDFIHNGVCNVDKELKL